MMRSKSRALVLPLLLAAVMGSALTSPVAAQTRFEWPDTTVQVAKYTTVEQCLAATARVRTGQEGRAAATSTVWRDTMPSADLGEVLKPAPAPVTETAARCAARFTEPTTDLHDFVVLLPLYLEAGRDADASALVARRMAAAPVKATRERTAVGDTAVDIYLKARPLRLDAAEQILLARARGSADRIERIALYSKLMILAGNVGDTARARRAARWVVAVADSLTTAERESEKFETLEGGTSGKALVFAATRVLTGLSVMLDSLRHGTAAFAALERSMWAVATGNRPESLPFPVGERAPTITADYWFPREAAGTPHPAPGRVSIFQFLDHDSCFSSTWWGHVRDNCTTRLATLRRLSERFPALEIILVSHTHGAFLYVKPPAPAEEAEAIRHWLEPFRVRGATIAVSSTPFWNLPRPDARRIDKDTPNLTSYNFVHNEMWKPTSSLFLIDQDGTLVATNLVESYLTQYIDVLMHRQQGGPEHATK
jgi:hypothetical protein